MLWPIESRLGMLQGLQSRTGLTGPAALEVYSDPQPTGLGDVPTDPPLAALGLPSPNGTVYAAGPLATDLAVWSVASDTGFVSNSGQVGWAQVVAADGAVIMRGRAGAADQVPTPDFIVSATTVYQGGEISATGAITL